MSPILFEMEDATMVDAAEMRDVTKNSEPSLPSCKSNLRLKKYVTHDLREEQTQSS